MDITACTICLVGPRSDPRGNQAFYRVIPGDFQRSLNILNSKQPQKNCVGHCTSSGYGRVCRCVHCSHLNPLKKDAVAMWTRALRPTYGRSYKAILLHGVVRPLNCFKHACSQSSTLLHRLCRCAGPEIVRPNANQSDCPSQHTPAFNGHQLAASGKRQRIRGEGRMTGAFQRPNCSQQHG